MEGIGSPACLAFFAGPFCTCHRLTILETLACMTTFALLCAVYLATNVIVWNLYAGASVRGWETRKF